MFLRSIPIVRSLVRTPVNNQVRHKSWSLMRPSNDIRSIVRDMERRMEDFERDFFQHSPFRLVAPIAARVMPIEGVDHGKKYRVDVDTHGFKPEDIKITLKDGVLKIEGHVEKSDNGGKIEQSFMQEFTVPENLDISTVESFLRNDGTLSIEGDLKLEDSKDGKKIPIAKGEDQDQAALKS